MKTKLAGDGQLYSRTLAGDGQRYTLVRGQNSRGTTSPANGHASASLTKPARTGLSRT